MPPWRTRGIKQRATSESGSWSFRVFCNHDSFRFKVAYQFNWKVGSSAREGGFWAYSVGQDPSDSKSKRLHVEIFRFCCFHSFEEVYSIDSSKMVGKSPQVLMHFTSSDGYFSNLTQWFGRILGITGWDPSVCRSHRLHFDILQFSFIKLGYIL